MRQSHKHGYAPHPCHAVEVLISAMVVFAGTPLSAQWRNVRSCIPLPCQSVKVAITEVTMMSTTLSEIVMMSSSSSLPECDTEFQRCHPLPYHAVITPLPLRWYKFRQNSGISAPRRPRVPAQKAGVDTGSKAAVQASARAVVGSRRNGAMSGAAPSAPSAAFCAPSVRFRAHALLPAR